METVSADIGVNQRWKNEVHCTGMLRCESTFKLTGGEITVTQCTLVVHMMKRGSLFGTADINNIVLNWRLIISSNTLLPTSVPLCWWHRLSVVDLLEWIIMILCSDPTIMSTCYLRKLKEACVQVETLRHSEESLDNKFEYCSSGFDLQICNPMTFEVRILTRQTCPETWDLDLTT